MSLKASSLSQDPDGGLHHPRRSLEFPFSHVSASFRTKNQFPRFVPISPNWCSFYRNSPKNEISPVCFWATPKIEKPEKHWYHGVFRLPPFSQIHVFPKVLCSGARSLSIKRAKLISISLFHFPPRNPLRTISISLPLPPAAPNPHPVPDLGILVDTPWESS